MERSFAWAARFRRPARDYERLATTLKGLHYFAFATLMLARMFSLLNSKFITAFKRSDLDFLAEFINGFVTFDTYVNALTWNIRAGRSSLKRPSLKRPG